MLDAILEPPPLALSPSTPKVGRSAHCTEDMGVAPGREVPWDAGSGSKDSTTPRTDRHQLLQHHRSGTKPFEGC
jgi:hypothetical protein